MANVQLKRGDKVTSLQVVKAEKQKISESAQRKTLAEIFEAMQILATRGEITGIFFCLDYCGRQQTGRVGTFREDLPALALATARLQQLFLRVLERSEDE